MLNRDKIMATLVASPKLAFGCYYDRHLGCGCLVGQFALAVGVPREALCALDEGIPPGLADHERDAHFKARAAEVDAIARRIEAVFGIPEWMLDFMFELNDAAEGETPMQRAERVRAALLDAMADWEDDHREFVHVDPLDDMPWGSQ